MNIDLLEKRTLSGYDAIKLNDDKLGSALEVIPGYGGRINGLWLSDDPNQYNIIEGYKNSDELSNDTFYHNVWLFPFINRLEGGVYQFEGKEYHFPINEPDKGNALHGFVFDKPFEVVDAGKEESFSFIRLKYNYDGNLEYYPFPFEFTLEYKLTAANTLEIDIKIKNTGNKKAPMAFGWHPYFTFSREIDSLEVTLPSIKRIAVNKNLIPTGEVINDERYLNGKEIQNDELDDNFVLNSLKKNTASILSEEDKAKITIEVDSTIKYMQMFTPPTRKSVAIEPVTSNINAFRTGNDLLVLEPGNIFSTNFKLMLTRTY